MKIIKKPASLILFFFICHLGLEATQFEVTNGVYTGVNVCIMFGKMAGSYLLYMYSNSKDPVYPTPPYEALAEFQKSGIKEAGTQLLELTFNILNQPEAKNLFSTTACN